MTIDDFWKLIEHIDRDALQRGEGFDELALQPLIGVLAVLTQPELQSFQDHLAQMLYELDGRRYAAAAGESGRSDDGFLYARCFVVAMGRDVYGRTLRDPDLMPKTLDRWCEPLLYATSRAWEVAHGERVQFDTKVSFETGSNGALW
jgi:Protein of unknown function (DUF4240)